MSKIKNGGLDQYGAEPFERHQFGTAGIEGVNFKKLLLLAGNTRRAWFGFHSDVTSRKRLQSLAADFVVFKTKPSERLKTGVNGR